VRENHKVPWSVIGNARHDAHYYGCGLCPGLWKGSGVSLIGARNKNSRPFSKGQSPEARKTHETGDGVVGQHGAVW